MLLLPDGDHGHDLSRASLPSFPRLAGLWRAQVPLGSTEQLSAGIKVGAWDPLCVVLLGWEWGSGCFLLALGVLVCLSLSVGCGMVCL